MQENFLFDPSINVLSKRPNPLNHLFFPKTIALIGATEREKSVGRTLLENLQSSFKGKIFAVNPKRKEVLGLLAYPSVNDIQEFIDLAVIVVPASHVLLAVKDCVQKKIPTAIIISAGFKEMGEKGRRLEEEILRETQNHNIRIVGPNCLGIMNPHFDLNATFARSMALKGNIAFISQSGALGTAILDWSLKEKIGFSSFVSIGSMIDVNWGDLIDYFGDDPHTESILIYMESVGDSRTFLSSAKAVALSKPIILIKAGVTEASAKAAASHTGALTGSDQVLDAALRRVGILRVDSLHDLFSMAEILKRIPKVSGPNLTIVTNAGGPAVIATDALVKNGGQLTKLSKNVVDELNTILPEAWSHNNPVDLLGDASPELFDKTLTVLKKEKTNSAYLVIVTPQHMTDAEAIAKRLTNYAHDETPILASWMGALAMEKGVEILSEANIPCFPFPDEASKIFSYMWKYSDNLKGLYETPTLYETISKDKEQKRKEKVQKIFAKVKSEKRNLLTEVEAKEVFEIFGIPTIPTYIAKTKEEAVFQAKKMGYPVVVKLYSFTVTHKKAVGGVFLNLENDQAVKEAFDQIERSVKSQVGNEHFQGVSVQPMVNLQEGYELILGSSKDRDFGPIIMFGFGGVFVEMVNDSALALPPLTSTLAKRVMRETKIFQYLEKKKGVDLLLLEKIFIRFSQLVSQFPEIDESDLNPLFIGPKGVLALDARIILEKKTSETSRLAISPYPLQYIEEKVLSDQKTKIRIRPIRPEDEDAVYAFFEKISEKGLKKKTFEKSSLKTLLKRERLIRFCFSDYDREISFILAKEEGDREEIFGVARLSKLPTTKEEAFFALSIDERYQKQGLGTFLLTHLLSVAKQEKIKILYAWMKEENLSMQALCKKLKFSLKKDPERPLIYAELSLD